MCCLALRFADRLPSLPPRTLKLMAHSRQLPCPLSRLGGGPGRLDTCGIGRAVRLGDGGLDGVKLRLEPLRSLTGLFGKRNTVKV